MQVADRKEESSTYAGHVSAEPYWNEALIEAERFGSNDERVAQSLSRLGLNLLLRGEYRRAEPLLRRAISIDEQNKVKAEVLASDFSNLGALLEQTDRLGESLKLYKRMYTLSKQLSPPESTGYVRTYASCLRRRGEVAEAVSLCKSALQRDEAAHVSEMTIAHDLDDLATAYLDCGQFAQAEECLLRAQTICDGKNVKMAGVSRGLARVAEYEKHYEQAEKLYEDCLTLQIERFGVNHKLLTLSLRELSRVKIMNGKKDEAKALEKKAAALGGSLPWW